MRNQVTIFLPTYSLLTPKSAHTIERVKTPILDEFMKGWIGMFLKAPKVGSD